MSNGNNEWVDTLVELAVASAGIWILHKIGKALGGTECGNYDKSESNNSGHSVWTTGSGGFKNGSHGSGRHR
jgi:hypothetical protein